MNLSILKTKLQEIDFSQLDISSRFTSVGDKNYYQLTNLSGARYVIRQLGDLGLVNQDINDLNSKGFFDILGDELLYGTEDGRSIKTIVDRIKSKVAEILSLLGKNLHNDEIGTLRIRLPKANDFEELATIFNDLKIAFSIPVRLLPDGGNVQVITAEPGSIWIVLFVPVAAAMFLISDLVYSAQVVKQDEEKDDLLLSLLARHEDKELENTVLEKRKSRNAKVISNEALGVMNRNGIEINPENIGFIENAIEKIIKQKKGGAVYLPSGTNSQEVIDSFPVEDQKAIVSKIPQLPEHLE